jgi:hypothetical protein
MPPRGSPGEILCASDLTYIACGCLLTFSVEAVTNIIVESDDLKLMTIEERKQLKPQLIEGGLWNADDARDPATDPGASVVLLETMKKLLANGTYLSYTVTLDSAQMTEMFVNRGDRKFLLATDGDLYVAICQAAIELPAFLKQLPEFAMPEKPSRQK